MLDIKSASNVPSIIEIPDRPHTESLMNLKKEILDSKSEIDKRA